ncbi:MAG TPA: hypothetical protein VIT92_03455 [Burkholderiaceae bacterium]
MRTALSLLLFFMSSAYAADTPPLRANLTLNHVAPGLWRAGYQFAEAVDAIKLEDAGDFRQTSWKVMTPGVELMHGKDGDTIARTDGKSFDKLEIEVRNYDGFLLKAYAPMNHFSDGGTAIYLGFLVGDAVRGNTTREMAADLEITGIKGEFVLAPPSGVLSKASSTYAYVGPLKPVQIGKAVFVLDPKLPEWVAKTLLDTGARVSAYFTQAYGRDLPHPLPILISVDHLDRAGLSLKGGVTNGLITYRLTGIGFVNETPEKRALIAQVVAHEMAHVWQGSVSSGGIGEEEPWIHEGGAEAMSVDALVATGIWDKTQQEKFVAKTLADCAAQPDPFGSYRGIYACGFKRFHDYPLAVAPLWTAMMKRTEATRMVYSEHMINAILAPPH